MSTNRLYWRMRQVGVCLARTLLRLTRTRVGAAMIGWGFAHMHNFLPLQRLYETEQVLAFYHPQPSYKVHILIVPKQAIPSLLTLTAAHGPVLQEVVAAAQQLVHELGLAQGGFRLVINGGAYQDVPQVHWHLIADHELTL